jgi:hypothetical protein
MYIKGIPGQRDRFLSPIEGLLLHDFPVAKIIFPPTISPNDLKQLIGNTQHCKAVGLAIMLAICMVAWGKRTKATSSSTKELFSYHEFHCRNGTLQRKVFNKLHGPKSAKQKKRIQQKKSSSQKRKGATRQNNK